MDYKPDFYIIPGVIANDENLPYTAGILYAVIYWFSKMSHGKCIASNQKLAQILGKGTTEKYVSELLKLLDAGGYIERVYSDTAKRNRTELIPLIFYRGASIPEKKTSDTSNEGNAIPEMQAHISNNYKEENKYIAPQTILPDSMGKTPLSRLKTFYSKLYQSEFGLMPKVFLNGKDGGVLKSMLRENTEIQVAALMIAHFNWYGADGGSDFEHEKLTKAAFPITWMTPNINKYILLLSGLHKLEYNEPKSVLKFVRNYDKGLSTD